MNDVISSTGQEVVAVIDYQGRVVLCNEATVPVLGYEIDEFEGMSVITLVDVTPHEVISRLKNDLIEKDSMASPEKVDQLEHRRNGEGATVYRSG